MEQISLYENPIAMEETIHKMLEPALLQVLSDNNILPHHLSFSCKKQYSSCVYKTSKFDKSDSENSTYGGIVYRIKMRGNSNYISVKNRYSKWISDMNKEEMSDGYTRIFISSESDIQSMIPILAKILCDTIESFPKEFDCCSRFEECSLCRKCIHPDPEFSLNCSYKFKLSHNVVFFGPNRTIE